MKKEKNMEKAAWQLPLLGPLDRNTLGLTGTDPLGSYTGVPDDRHEIPVQDADDL